MANVGLLFVGAVLFVNGVMLLGWVDAKSAAPLNIFVGALQVVTPTYLIFTANGNTNQILAASGLYLFGFTYLYVAINLLAGLDSTGGGFFFLFVAVCAVVFAGLNFWRDGFGDGAFGVIWLNWAFLWTLFFILLGLKVDSITRYTGAVAAIQGWVTGTIPAFLLLTGNWDDNNNWYGVALAIFSVVAYAGLYFFFPQLRGMPSRRRAARAGVPLGSPT
ncbi:MAG: ureI [Acidimicrobiales bacterium]|nr:ureI [Acidimicrobiales bacterium]